MPHKFKIGAIARPTVSAGGVEEGADAASAAIPPVPARMSLRVIMICPASCSRLLFE